MAAKLPRRTMSMAKRAVKLAEDASDVDAVEAVLGAPHAGKAPAFEGMVAWAAAILGIVVLMLAGTLVCSVANTGESDFSPEGALPHVTGGDAFYREGDPADGRMGTGRDSPFPEAQQEDPIILEVVCPPGTVHVATGPDAADSLCVVGQLAGQPTAAPTFAPTLPEPTPTTFAPTAAAPTGIAPRALPDTGQGIDQSTIGATLVPFGLHCAEDELIAFDPSGQPTIEGLPIGCVHVDTFCPVGQHVGGSDRCEP